MNDRFVTNSFPIIICKVGFLYLLDSFSSTTDEIENPWCLYSSGELLGVSHSNVLILPSTRRSSTHEYRGTVSL